MKRSFVFLSILLCFSLLWAVSAQEHEETDNAALVEQGRESFLALGCTACHGMNGEGTDLAPALAGHSDFAIRRQLRAPIGIMPVYSPSMVSAEDVDALVAYIQSLEAVEVAHEHGEASLPAGDISFAHHWLLYLALLSENQETASHQIEHIQAYIEAGHLAQMENLLALVDEGDFEAALPIAEAMVADVEVFGEDAEFVYVQMIYRALLLEDTEASEHFISDYLAHGENHEYIHVIEDVRATVEAGDFDAAVALLEAAYGESLLFELGDAEVEEAPTEEADEHSGH